VAEVVRSLADWQTLRNSSAYAGQTVGFVPTMGALHQGHLSLASQSRAQNNRTVVSIFVNPTQFNDPKDLEKYPRTLEADMKLLSQVGVDHVIFPTFEEIYPDQYRYKITENEVSQILCGAYRPGHFDGVLTVVMKLLNLVRPTRAYFGEKDFQQLTLIKDMVDAFFMSIEIVPGPTVRELDGLAMSSRNVRLTPEDRTTAAELPKILKSAKTNEEAKAQLSHQGFRVDYVESHWGRRLAAVHLGQVRLIDNVKI
jgi:pantoate--beta-alanine ligase